MHTDKNFHQLQIIPPAFISSVGFEEILSVSNNSLEGYLPDAPVKQQIQMSRKSIVFKKRPWADNIALAIDTLEHVG
jgi:hypothetical protein